MERTFDTPTPPQLELRLPGGLATIDAAAGATSTEISLDGPPEALEAATIEQRGDVVLVEIRNRKRFLGLREHEVSLRIRCPELSALDVRSSSLDVVARGLLASVEAATASGDVLAERVEGDATMKSASGDLQLGEAGGNVTCHTASGDAEIGRAGGSLRANLVSGDLRVREAAGAVSANSVSGDLRVDCVAAGAVQLQSVSGDVEVGIRRGSRVHVDASTLSGDTRSELDLGGEPSGDEGPLVELRIKTVSGDVAVVRASTPTPQEV
jgi:DUF4097 and DUF4098 domain-containing protein YvlB